MYHLWPKIAKHNLYKQFFLLKYVVHKFQYNFVNIQTILENSATQNFSHICLLWRKVCKKPLCGLPPPVWTRDRALQWYPAGRQSRGYILPLVFPEPLTAPRRANRL